jgi:hypothetical protein
VRWGNELDNNRQHGSDNPLSIPEPNEGEFVAADPKQYKPSEAISHLHGDIFIVKYRVGDAIIEVETCRFKGTTQELDLSAGWIVLSEEDNHVMAQRALI